jgi:hypothetical protein
MGAILKPIDGKDLGVYVDAAFCGNWDPKETWDVNTARSRHGYIISYAGCPTMWKSPLKVNASYALQDALRCNPNN